MYSPPLEFLWHGLALIDSLPEEQRLALEAHLPFTDIERHLLTDRLWRDDADLRVMIARRLKTWANADEVGDGTVAQFRVELEQHLEEFDRQS